MSIEKNGQKRNKMYWLTRSAPCQWSAAPVPTLFPNPTLTIQLRVPMLCFASHLFHLFPLGWRATVQCSSISFGTVLRMQHVEYLRPRLRSPLPVQVPPWPTFAATSSNIAPRPPFQTFLHDALSITLGNVSTISSRHTHLHPLHRYDSPGLIISSFFPLSDARHACRVSRIPLRR
jgi:hypothetical protein